MMLKKSVAKEISGKPQKDIASAITCRVRSQGVGTGLGEKEWEGEVFHTI